MILTGFSIMSCQPGGGGGSVSTGNVYFDHQSLANEFVHRVYTDLGVYLTIMKTWTLQNGYIVVNNGGVYEAYFIDGWSVGTDLNYYLASGKAYAYSGLDYIGGNNYYRDPISGVVFDEAPVTSKNAEKIAAFKEQLSLKYSAEKLQAEFGLSEKRSYEVAKIAYKLKNTPQTSNSIAYYDQASKDILGTSLTDIMDAAKNAKSKDDDRIQQIVAKAAEVNEIDSPEQMQRILNKLIP